MLNALQIATVILTAVAMTPALAHALEWPGKKRLGREAYLAVQTIYYPGFTIAGGAEPLAVVLLAVTLAFTPGGTAAFALTAAALAVAALTHLLYWLVTAPVNKVWLRHEKLGGSAERFFGAGGDLGDESDWIALRDRWETSHLWRSATAASAFLLATLALASRSGGVA